jgi:hypothetical protein
VRSNNDKATGQADTPLEVIVTAEITCSGPEKSAQEKATLCVYVYIAERVCRQVCVDARLLFLMKEGGRITMMGMKKENGGNETK